MVQWFLEIIEWYVGGVGLNYSNSTFYDMSVNKYGVDYGTY